MEANEKPELVIRPEIPTDHEAVHGLTAAAFDREDEATLVDALRQDAGWIDGLSWVAELDGRIVGHALATRCHIGKTPALCLAPCSVAPDLQGEGVGSLCIDAVIAAAQRQGEKFMTVLGHPNYYPRFGFLVDPRVTLPFEVDEGAFMVLKLAQDSMPAGEVKYADAFGI